MTTSVFLAPTPILQFFNNLGQPNAGGSVLTQVGGVNYPTYEDSAGSTPLPNPIPLNSRGEVSNSSGISTQLFLESGVVYTFTLYDASHNQINQATWMGANFVAASDYSNGYLNRVVDSIADLRSIKSSLYTRVFVTGYYAAGDGGGGAYWYDPTDTTSADNGVTIIVASDGARWKLEYATALSVKQAGAKGDGTTDDSAAFGTTVVSTLTVAASTGDYYIATNTTVSADLIFQGGAINVASGITLTINGSILAPSKVIFKGAGTVVCNKGDIDCSWFDGTDASSKFAFLARMLTNSNGLTKTVIFPTPAPTDAWAAISAKAQWGYGWKVTSPILVTQLVGNVTFKTPAPFVATAAMPAIWDMGSGTAKADGWHFVDRLLLDGSAQNCTDAMLIEGASSWSINWVEIHNSIGGINIKPSGTKQVSGFIIEQIICAENTSYSLNIEGSSATNSISDFVVEQVLCYGLSVAGATASVFVKGNVQDFRIGNASVRAVNTGEYDFSVAVVYVTNEGGQAPAYGCQIGMAFANSTTNTAKAIVIADSSGGTGPKIEGVTIDGALSPTAPAVDIDWCSDTKIRDVDSAATVNVGANALDTWVNGCRISNVTDAGSGTRIEGKVRRIVTIADSTAVSIPIPSYCTDPYLVTATTQGVAVSDTVMFYGRSYVALSVAAIFTGSSTTVVTGTLSGTTGSTGHLNFSAATGAVDIENRTGVSQTVAINIELND